MIPKIIKNHFVSCMPITPTTEGELAGHLKYVKTQSPDFIEWRRDYFKDERPKIQKRVFAQLIDLDIPVIYTYRSYQEGGVADVSDAIRFENIRDAILTGHPAYLDIEVHHLPCTRSEIQGLLSHCETDLILSAHVFDHVLDQQGIKAMFTKMEKYRPDVIKLAQTPRSKDEAQRAIEIVKGVSENYDRPIIHVLMGPYGKKSRVFPEKCGGSLTYVSGLSSTAMGQLELEKILALRQIQS